MVYLYAISISYNSTSTTSTCEYDNSTATGVNTVYLDANDIYIAEQVVSTSFQPTDFNHTQDVFWDKMEQEDRIEKWRNKMRSMKQIIDYRMPKHNPMSSKSYHKAQKRRRQ